MKTCADKVEVSIDFVLKMYSIVRYLLLKKINFKLSFKY